MMKSINQSLNEQWRTNPQQVSNKQAITKSVILLMLLCMRSNQVFCKCLKWSPLAGFHNVNSKVQCCTLLFNETKIHSNCKQYAFTQQKATHCRMVIDGNWQSTIKYSQSSRERISKAFLALPRLHSVVSEMVWSILMSVKAAEALLKILKFQTLLAPANITLVQTRKIC